MATRILLLALLALLTTALQSAVIPHLGLLGARPDLPLLLTITVGLLAGPVAGMGVGFGAGLLQGALDAAQPGGSAALLTVLGYLAGVLRARVFVEHWAAPMLFAGLLTLAAHGARALIWRSGGWDWPASVALLAGGAVYNAILAYPAFALARRARRLLPG